MFGIYKLTLLYNCATVYLSNKYSLGGEHLELIISNNNSKPIYEQITDQIKTLIMNGELNAGEPLPSMRSLAKSLHISVITAQRAYEDLQRDGFIETVTGRGTFVATQNKAFIQEEQQRKIEEHLEIAAEIARTNGIKLEKLYELLKMFYTGGE